jgi:hypothetical protein
MPAIGLRSQLTNGIDRSSRARALSSSGTSLGCATKDEHETVDGTERIIADARVGQRSKSRSCLGFRTKPVPRRLSL